MNAWVQSLSPSSAVTTGTTCATGKTVLVQQDSVTQAVMSYSWNDATRAFAGSFGRDPSHWVRSLPHPTPDSSSGWVAPAIRTALTSVCIPAACQPPLVVHPLSQQSQEISCGSL